MILSFSSCKGQKTLIESKSKDIIVFEFEDNNVKSLKNKKHITSLANDEIFNNNKIIIITQRWKGYGTGHFDKTYSFIKEKDTMNIYCICGQEANRYIQNIRFQKGNYKLHFENDVIIKGSELADKELEKLTFKNAYMREENNTIIKQAPFKELDFYKISLKDKGVELKKRD
jgi:hypothetical protein